MGSISVRMWAAFVIRATALALLVLCSVAVARAVKDHSSAQVSEEEAPPSKPIPFHLSHGHFYTESHAKGDLPQLPISRSPTHKSWNNSVAICAVTKLDHTTDVREWVQYHRCVGVPSRSFHVAMISLHATQLAPMRTAGCARPQPGRTQTGTLTTQLVQVAWYRACLSR